MGNGITPFPGNEIMNSINTLPDFNEARIRVCFMLGSR